MHNFIIGIMGKKGSGKTELTKKALHNFPRVIILDILHEYEGVIFNDVDVLINFIKEYHEMQYIAVYRPLSDEKADKFFKLLNIIEDFVLILEEADNWCDSKNIQPDLHKFLKYGRHGNRNVIWITRCPYEINRYLTRESDLIISFLQSEPRDLEYMKKYTTFNKEISKLKYYEYAYWTDYPDAEKLLNYFN